MRTPHILVIEDDRHIAELISLYLLKDGCRCTLAADGREGLESFYADPPDLIVLDIMLPQLDGWQVMEEVRALAPTPVIMVTGKGESYDKLRGFGLGADDYIVKPFEPKELAARVKAVLRRANPACVDETVRLPGLTIYPAEYRAEVDGAEFAFPPKEIELLHFLAVNRSRVFTRDQLLRQIWGADFDGDSRTVDVHIKRIRAKIGDREERRIATVWGVGYKFEVLGG